MAIIFTTLIAFGLIFYVTAFANSKRHLTAGRHHVAAAAGGVRGGQRRGAGAAARRASGRRAFQDADRPARHRVPGIAVSRDAAVGPARPAVCAGGDPVGIGIVLFFVTMLINRQLGIRDAGITDPTHLGDVGGNYDPVELFADGLQLRAAPASSSLRRERRSSRSSLGGWHRAPARSGRHAVGGQARRDDVARLEIAVDRHVVRPVIPVQRDVGAHARRRRDPRRGRVAGRAAASTRLRNATQSMLWFTRSRGTRGRAPRSASSASAARAGARRTRPACTSGSSRARTARRSPDAGRPRSPVGSAPDAGSMSRPRASASTRAARRIEQRVAGVRRIGAGVELAKSRLSAVSRAGSRSGC